MSVIFRRLVLSLGIVTLISLAACGVSDPKNPRFVVAKGKGVEVTRGEMDDALNQVLSARGLSASALPPERLPEIQKNIIDQLVIEKLLLKESKSLHLKDIDQKTEKQYKDIVANSPSPEIFKEQLEKRKLTPEKLKGEIRKQTILQATVEANIPEPAAPSDADIEKFYNENANRFNRETQIRASHILILVKQGATPAEKADKKKAADAARARIAKGEAFAKVAQEVSEDKGSAQNGGDLDYFRKGMMVPEFEKVAFSSKIGVVSPVFESSYGYHILVVTDVKAGGKVPLQEAKENIANFLKNSQRRTELGKYLEKIKKDADVKITLPPAPAPAPTAAAAPAPQATAPAPTPAPAPADKK
jgi:peptidyl-prolyl cis-trans isomerase C